LTSNAELTLAQAIALFLQKGGPKQVRSQQELNKLTRWFQGNKRLLSITAAEVQAYSEQLPAGASQNEEHLKPLRSFFIFVRNEGLIAQNLSSHLRPRRLGIRASKTSIPVSAVRDDTVQLTKEGYEEIENQLALLREQLPLASREIERAAADGDVRENAPLEAAKVHQGQLMDRIHALENTMAKAVILDGTRLISNEKVLVQQGSRVTVLEIASDKEFTWILVDPREANLAESKLSISSPVGQAILGTASGEEIEVLAPSRKVGYRIVNIG
jgi:transcription elongation factor GreA